MGATLSELNEPRRGSFWESLRDSRGVPVSDVLADHARVGGVWLARQRGWARRAVGVRAGVVARGLATGAEVVDAARAVRVPVAFLPGWPQRAGLAVRAEYDPAARLIRVWRGPLAAAAEAWGRPLAAVAALLTAHERCHVALGGFGPPAAAELAALEGARQLCGWTWLMPVYDWLAAGGDVGVVQTWLDGPG